ncbi:MAG: hypothetical protein JSV27_12560 [Candidatus Bathyarchaeota archaeon]|nr:MAG: hypothetical protein JSV27_12560 [Candidatus Bathyarchaeota archaeon]
MVGASFIMTNYTRLRFGSRRIRDSLWTSRTGGASSTSWASRTGGTSRASLPRGTLTGECHSYCDD